MPESDLPQPRQRHVWPWFVLIGFLLWLALVALWMAAEIRRTRQQRDFQSPPPARAQPQSARANYLSFPALREQVISRNVHERRTGTGRAASRAGQAC